jgi:hypothetical protein
MPSTGYVRRAPWPGSGLPGRGTGAASFGEMPSPDFRVNTPTVAAETVDGEVLMINLESGNYYSLRDTGAAIWDGIEHGVPTAAIATALAGRLPGADTAALVADFLAELAAEQLVVPLDAPDDPATGAGVDVAWTPPAPAAPSAPAAPPALEKFTDMQHLILLDPVHEVDAAEGWPIQRSDA